MTNERKPYSWFFPESVDAFIKKNIPLDLYDLREQYYRALTHILMRTTVSQFYSQNTLKEIKEDIDRHLNNYDCILDNVSYISLKHRLMAWALRNRQYTLLHIFSSPFIQRRMH